MMVVSPMLMGWWTRERRVLLLLAAVAVLSLADLYMTMAHVTGAGMYEENPLARAIMKMGSPAFLAMFKVVSLGVAVGILYAVRGRASSELGSWLCLGVLVWLTGRWVVYNNAADALTDDMNYIKHARDHRWVAMSGAD